MQKIVYLILTLSIPILVRSNPYQIPEEITEQIGYANHIVYEKYDNKELVNKAITNMLNLLHNAPELYKIKNFGERQHFVMYGYYKLKIIHFLVDLYFISGQYANAKKYLKLLIRQKKINRKFLADESNVSEIDFKWGLSYDYAKFGAILIKLNKTKKLDKLIKKMKSLILNNQISSLHYYVIATCELISGSSFPSLMSFKKALDHRNSWNKTTKYYHKMIYTEACNTIGSIYYQKSQFQNAYEYFTNALSYNENYLPAKINLALTIKKLKQQEQVSLETTNFMKQNRRLIDILFQKTQYLKIRNGKNIAILPFTCIQNLRPIIGFSKILESIFINGLSTIKRYNLVERDKLKFIQNEIALSRSNWSDKKFIIKIGKIVSANYMITGTYLVEGNSFIVDYRVIDTTTGVIIRTASIKGKNLYHLRQQIYDSLKKLNF